MAIPIDITGVRFGRLVALRRIGSMNGKSLWEFRCDCGKLHQAKAGDVRHSGTQSCGCLKNCRHGLSTSPEYQTWFGMLMRCYNPKRRYFRYYGGRGITVCDRWRNSFDDFLSDMGPRPSLEYSIDRINNNGNYEPGNCRWILKSEQSKKRRNNVLITKDGTTHSMAEWCRILRISKGCVWHRIKSGMTPLDAISKPSRSNGSKCIDRQIEKYGVPTCSR